MPSRWLVRSMVLALTAGLGCSDGEPSDLFHAEVGGGGSGAAPTGGAGGQGAGAPGGDGGVGGVGGTGGEIDPTWEAFAGKRIGYLEALGEPILECVQGPGDSSHPAFDGCIDWHSAVHGTYSLLALYRITGDPLYQSAADAVLEPTAVAGELQDLQQGAIVNELPYGFAWFLALARERERSTGDTDLVPLAAEVAEQLQAWMASRTPSQIAAGALADDYASLSWAVLNLWEQAVHDGDAARIQFAQQFTATHLLPLDAQCPLADEEQNIDDFFPPCLHRARAILRVLPEDQRPGWAEAFLPTTLALTPLGPPPNAHSAGLNFSRSWGLWSIFEATGQTVYRDLYIAHVDKHMSQPQYWDARYRNYAHWVAQFGVYAIALTFDPPPP